MYTDINSDRICNIAVHRNIPYNNLNLILHNDLSVFCEFLEHQGFCIFFHSLSNHKEIFSHQLLPLDDLQLCVDLNISLICTPSHTGTLVFFILLFLPTCIQVSHLNTFLWCYILAPCIRAFYNALYFNTTMFFVHMISKACTVIISIITRLTVILK